MKIEKFEDMNIWQEARRLANRIYAINFDDKSRKDFSLRDQMQRAGISIMSNIAEGYERNNNLEFVTFLRYAKGSAGEVRAQLHLAYDLGYIKDEEYQKLHKDVVSISKQLSRFSNYLRKNKK